MIRRIGATPIGVWAIRHLVSPLHRRLYRASGGKLLPMGGSSATSLLLTTKGRRTGKERTTPMFYLRDGDRLVVCNVNPGFERTNPWVLNLRAHPVVRAQIGTEAGDYQAREATEKEMERYWPRFVQLWPAYQAHFERSGRRTLFVLELIQEPAPMPYGWAAPGARRAPIGHHHVKRGRSLLVVMSAFLFLCGLVAVLFNAWTESLTPTPPGLAFDSSLPGRNITENGLNADFFCNESARPRKVVIMVGGSGGGKEWSAATVLIRRLLGEGYCVLSLAYFRAPGLPEDLREIPLEYFANAFRWLAEQEAVYPDDYAFIGISRGGEATLLLASRYSQIKAVVALVPSYVVFPGNPTGFFDALAGQHSAWSYQGQPLPFVPMPVSLTSARGLLTVWTGSPDTVSMFDEALQNKMAVEAAAIPVEDIGGPMLCISELHDEQWRSTLMCAQIMERLDQNGFPFFHEHISYDRPHGWCGAECGEKIVDFLGEHFR